MPPDASQRATAIQALESAFAANTDTDDLPPGYDFFAAMNANRAPGERLPYPPETKGTAR